MGRPRKGDNTKEWGTCGKRSCHRHEYDDCWKVHVAREEEGGPYIVLRCRLRMEVQKQCTRERERERNPELIVWDCEILTPTMPSHRIPPRVPTPWPCLTINPPLSMLACRFPIPNHTTLPYARPLSTPLQNFLFFYFLFLRTRSYNI